MLKKHKTIALLLALMAFLLLTAFVQPLELLLSNVEEKSSGWTSLTVHGQRLINDASKNSSNHIDFTLSLKRPSSIKLEITDPQTATVKAVKQLPSYVKNFLEVMLNSDNKSALFEKLSKLDVNKSPLGLGRIDNTICQIIGALEGQENKSQFWLDKFNYFPMRLLYLEVEHSETDYLEILMTNWTSPMSMEVFPETVTFKRNGKLLEKWTITLVEPVLKK